VGSSKGVVRESWPGLRLERVRRTISNKEFRTAEVIERNKTMFFTSIFCDFLFCDSAVHILNDVIVEENINRF